MTAIAIAILLSMILAPGLGATLALYGPRTLSFPTKLAVSLAFGYTIIGGAAFVLTILSVLTPTSFFLLAAILTIAAWVVAMRRAPLREHLRALVSEFRDERGPLILGLAVIAGIAVMRLGFLADFPSGFPFRYWIDGVEIADGGGIPSLTLHYGALWPPVTSKSFLNVFTAGAHYATAGNMTAAIPAMVWVTAVGTAIGLWATARELGLRWIAPLVPVLVMANEAVFGNEITRDLSAYRAEIVGRMVAFCILPLGLRALRSDGSVRDAVAAAVCLAAVAGTHLVGYIAAVVIVFWFGVARIVLDRDRRWDVLRRAGAMAAVGAILTVAVLLLPRGSIGFEGAANEKNYRPAATSFDKTYFLYAGKFRPPRHRAFYASPAVVVRSFASSGLGLPAGSPIYGRVGIALLSLAGVGAAFAMLRWFPRELRAIGVVSVGLAGTLVALAMGFSYRFDLYIPATFGIRRLFDYAPLTVILVLLASLEAGLLLLRRSRVHVTAGVVLVVAALVIPTALVRPEGLSGGEQTRAMLSWVRENTPCDARILTNQRSVGAFRALTGRVAVLEGMGPFLRPRMLDVVVDQILGARGFYAAPAQNRRYLAEYGIDYVLFSLRPGDSGKLSAARFQEAPFLQPVLQAPTLHAYRVVGVPASKRFPDPRRYPAYRCQTGALV